MRVDRRKRWAKETTSTELKKLQNAAETKYHLAMTIGSEQHILRFYIAVHVALAGSQRESTTTHAVAHFRTYECTLAPERTRQ